MFASTGQAGDHRVASGRGDRCRLAGLGDGSVITASANLAATQT